MFLLSITHHNKGEFMRHAMKQHRKEHKTREPRTEEHKSAKSKPDTLKLQQVQIVTDELKRLLQNNNTAFDDEVIRRQVDLLEHWMDCYRRDLFNVDTFSEASAALISDLRARLKLAGEEVQRLEDEGWAVPNREQLEENEEMLRAIARSEQLLLNIEELFSIKNH
jgi:hypothetical protein